MVIWSTPAKTDLRSIHDFIAHNSKHYAKKVIQDIREKTDILESVPHIGKMVVEINNENVRELSLYSYRIIYQIKNDKVFALTVVHKRRDFKPEDIQQ